MLRRRHLLSAVCLLAPVLGAHTVPTITAEAEFGADRAYILRVNLDPRLLLSEQPATLPPVPAAWWFDQNENARADSLAAAAAFVERTVRFQAGDSRLEGGWKVVAVDSASAFPLGPNSAETHLLAEQRGSLPDAAGEFKVTLDERAAVGLILLNSVEGKAERYPQAIFPGESSRGFKLPERTEPDPVPVASMAADRAPAAWCRVESRHSAADHLLVALALAVVLGGRIIPGVVMIALFVAFHAIGALAVTAGWMPEAPLWMQAAGWLALAVGLLQAHRRRVFRAAACFAIAGLCHGLSIAHLHLTVGEGITALREAALTGATQVAVLVLAWVVVALVRRGRRGEKEGAQIC